MRTYTGFKKLRYQTYFNNEVYLPYAKFVYIPIAMFMVFAITDVVHFKEESYLPVILRISVCLAMIGSAFYCLNYKPRAFQFFEAVLLVFSSLFLVYVGRLAIDMGNYDYQGGILLVMVYAGTFSRMSARYSLAALFCSFLCYVLGLAPLLYEVDPHHEVESLSIHFSTFILVAAACLRRDLEAHKRFSQSLKIRQQSIMLRKQARKFKSLSFIDTLTQCKNRLFLHETIEPSLTDDTSIAVYMLDIDHFKGINDKYGHQVGDAVLRELAQGILASLPADTHCIRYGGEEFLILAKGLLFNGVEVLGSALLESTTKITSFKEERVTVSIGVSFHEKTQLSLDALIEQADQALYHSKQNGRDQLSWFIK